MKFFISTVTVTVLVAFLIFPAIKYHICSGYRGKQAFSNILRHLFNRTFSWQLTSTTPERIQRIRLTGAGGDMLLCPYCSHEFSKHCIR